MGPGSETAGYRGSVLIRDAVPHDWAAIWPFFRAIVADGESYTYPTDMTEAEAEADWMGHEHVLVVEDEGRILASAVLGPNRPGRGRHVANASFMIDPASAGRGIGRRLGEHVLEVARSAGYRAMQFNAVVETNDAAVRLWQSLGFTILGTIPEAFDSRRHGLVGLHVMHRSLVAPEAAPDATDRPDQRHRRP
jgi:L-amino acid N-acyltransferase YncA